MYIERMIIMKNQKGVTVLSLVLAIVILSALIGVSFAMLFGGIALLKDLFDAYPISYNRERIVENELSKRGD